MENTVPPTFDGLPNPGAGNPMLYRVSKGHGGVFCEACHGQNGEGTVLSAMHTDRVLAYEDSTAFCPDGVSQLFPEGHQVTCSDCHANELESCKECEGNNFPNWRRMIVRI